MSMESILAAAEASGCLAVIRNSRPPESPARAAVPAPTPRAEPPGPREPMDLASLSIAPTRTATDWTPPPTPVGRAPTPETPSSPIDIASLSIAPTDTAKKSGRKRRWRAKHEDLYVISREELAARLAARRERRRTPSRKRGEMTNQHRIAMVMEPGEWYSSPDIEYQTDLPLNVVAPTLLRMKSWPRLYVERREMPGRKPSFRVPAPYGRGGGTLRTPAQWIYRLTESGRELRREGEDIAARAKAE